MAWFLLLLLAASAVSAQRYSQHTAQLLQKAELYEDDLYGQKRYKAHSFMPGSFGERESRIPDSVEPIEYFIQVQPYFPYNDISIPAGKKNMTFDGLCTFVFRVKCETNNVTLHSLLLNYKSAKLMNEDRSDLIPKAQYTFDKELDHIIVSTGNTLKVGQVYMLQFVYVGDIHYYMDSGLYYTSYVDLQGNTHFMLATQFEPGRARLVFPCLDEPAYKAVFHITLIYPAGLVALANSMERPAVPMKERGWEVIQFPPSLKMSTYLVAFAIGPYVNAQTVNDDGVVVRIWGWTGQERYLTFAVDVAAGCLHQMGVYLNYTYPYIKTDQLGLPEFVAGAMENYGLIIYKYKFVAIHPDVSTTDDKQAAARTICHELAHQWFGNTVTAKWWDDLFLQEGFAAFFENFNLKRALPQQEPYIMAKWLTRRVQPSLRLDAMVSESHPLYAYDGPKFDAITYGKGASVLRMIHSVLGDDPFQKALQEYIKDYQFSNADHQMLFDKFTKYSTGITDWCGRPLNATRFLNPWFLQQGFPLVTLTNNQLMGPSVLTQEPFNSRELLPDSHTTFNYSWPIPFISSDYKNSYMSQHDTLQWIKPGYETECPSSRHTRAVHWDKGNSGSRSHLRIQYDDIGFARLMDRLKTNRDEDFLMQDQMELIGDQLALLKKRMAEPGVRFSYKDLIALLKAIIPNNPHFGAFEMARLVIPTLERMFMDGPDHVLFQKFVQKLLAENYKLLSLDVGGESWDENIARYNMMPYMVRYEVDTAAKDAYARFKQFIVDCQNATSGIEECSKVHPDVRRAVYCAGSRYGTDEEFKKLLDFFEQQVKNNYYFYGEYYAMYEGMACATQKARIDKVIKIGLRKFKYRRAILSYIVQNPKGSQWMLDYLKAHPEEVLTSGKLYEYVDAMTSTWYSKTRLQQLEDLEWELTLNVRQEAIFDGFHDLTFENVDWWSKYYPDLSRVFYDAFVVGPFEMENWNTRLPHNIEPSFYNIKIRPNFPGSAVYPWYKNMTFDGSVDIEFTVVKDTTEIMLESHRMIIEKTGLTLTNRATKQSYAIDGLIKDLDYAFLTIQTKAPLTKGSKWTLSINYIGLVWGHPSKGVYTNTNFFEFNGKKAWIFSTYFESGPSARSFVPCFDEPNYKARWQMTLDHPADMIALGNMPEQRFEVLQDGWARTYFPPTPPMSSYLLAVASGHFASLEKVSETGHLIRIWSWTGMEIYAEVALKTVAATVDFMSSYFEFPYPLPKLDMLALPQYTTMKGAEEHWGFIHIAYKRALIDPDYADAVNYADVAGVTAHETVHQWYGDLVTIQFWPVIFLNEAFANYWETFGVEKAFPTQTKYNKFERFRKALAAYELDSSAATSKPVVPDKPKYFTRIPYHKGASLLHMLSNTISPRVLQLGLQQYLKKYQYSNTMPVDLWTEITEAARNASLVGWDGKPLNVQELMDTWIYQATYPVLKVVNNAGMVTYSQEPFIIDRSGLQESPYNWLWIIPVFSQTIEGTSFHYFKGKDGSNASWSRPLASVWQVENPAFMGYYRVWYDDDTWDPIFAQLNSDPLVFDELTRAQFVSDAIALQERGSLEWPRVLDLLFTLRNEKELAPWYAAKPTLDRFIEMFRNTSQWNPIKAFLGKIIAERYATIGWKKSGDWSYDILATYVTDLACMIDHSDCRRRASDSIKKFVVSCEHSASGTGRCNKMPPEMRLAQYCWGTHTNPELPDVVGKMYLWFEENMKYFPRDRYNLLEGQACTTNPTRMNKLIESALNGQLPSEVVTYIGKRDDAQYLWDFFTGDPDQVKYGVVNTTDYMTAAMAHWNSEADIAKISTYLDAHPNTLSSGDLKAIEHAKGTVSARINWLTTNQKPIGDWLTQHAISIYE